MTVKQYDGDLKVLQDSIEKVYSENQQEDFLKPKDERTKL
jgi:hypothetical protein